MEVWETSLECPSGEDIPVSSLLATENRIRDDIALMTEKMADEFLVIQRFMAALQQGPAPTSTHSRPKSGPLGVSIPAQRQAPSVAATLDSEKNGDTDSPANLMGSGQSGFSTGFANSHGVAGRMGRWEGWPEDIFLREAFVLSDQDQNLSKLQGFAATYKHKQLSVTSSQVENISGFWQRLKQCRVLHPTSRLHIVFDLLCMFVIFLQVMYLPFALVWTEEVEDIDGYVLLATAIFWFFDMCLHFVTGYHNADGEVEMQLLAVLSNYLRTWFAPDCLCVAADVVNYLSAVAMTDNNTSAARIVYLVKVQRILRALLMVRMLRVAKMVYNYMETQLSATWLFVLRTWQFATLMLWLTHVVACIWYAVGRHASSGLYGSRWVDTAMPGSEGQYRIQDTDVLYQYMTSYHWSLAQITLGGLDINPTNSAERSVAIACNFFGLFFGGMVVSILSTTLMELREINHDHEVKMRKLRDFLLQHGMGIGIRLRVIRQVHDRMKLQQGMALVEKDVLALKVVSVTLLRELRYHLYFNLVRMHPLLHSWTLLQAEGIKQLCSEGVNMIVLLPDDELFVAGALSKSAYLVKQGNLEYTLRAIDGPCNEEQVDRVPAAMWISEATWWCHWYHVGAALACNTCTLLSVAPSAILECMDSDPVIAAITIEYGIRFHRYIVTAKDSPVTDVNVQYADFNGLLCTMPTEVHVILGMAALQQLVASGQHWRLERDGTLEKLKGEVAEGRSLVIMDHKGTLHRRVAATMLQLESKECDVPVRLTQVAYFDVDALEWKPMIQLPGVKQTDGESPSGAMARIVQQRLCLPSTCEMTATKWIQNMENHSSKQFGVGTHYLMTTGIVQMDKHIAAHLNKHRHLISAESLTKEISKTLTSLTAGPSGGNLFYTGSLTLSGNRTWPSHEDLEGQIDAVYVVYAPSPVLYVWMSKQDFKRLREQEASLSRLIAGLVECMDDGVMEEILHNVKRASFELGPAGETGGMMSFIDVSDAPTPQDRASVGESNLLSDCTTPKAGGDSLDMALGPPATPKADGDSADVASGIEVAPRKETSPSHNSCVSKDSLTALQPIHRVRQTL